MRGTVAIVHGWSEGKAHSSKLKKMLRAEGFEISKNLKTADVIIAHSGGCFMMPETSSAKIVLLVGLPHNPGTRLSRSLRTKLKTDPKNKYWYKKSVLNSYYFIRHPRRHQHMYKNWKNNKLPEFEDASFIAIHNEKDPFIHSAELTKLADEKNWKLKRLSGHHDDIWSNPAPYIQILKEGLS